MSKFAKAKSALEQTSQFLRDAFLPPLHRRFAALYKKKRTKSQEAQKSLPGQKVSFLKKHKYFVFALLAFLAAYLFRPLPDRLSSTASLELYSEDGHRLAAFRERKNGSFQFARDSLEDYPRDLRKMVLFSEDRRMAFHPGVDPIAILRAARQNLRQGRIVSGASTIAMQLVRILYDDRLPRNPWLRKFIQIYYAIRLSFYHSDKELLLAYLNSAPLPGNQMGFAAASVHLFGRDIFLLGQEEKALLVVLLRSSSAPRPVLKNRLNKFLRSFQKYEGRQIPEKYQKPFSKSMLDSVYAKKSSPAHISRTGPHFVLFVKTKFPWLSGPLRTTLDANWNERISRIIQNEFPLIERAGAEDAAVVVLERTGPSENPQRQVLKLRALVGSRNFYDPKDGQINGALIHRNAGSSLKPFVYGLAFDRLGLRPWDKIEDTEVSFSEEDGGSYRPRNYDLRFWGALSIREALATSRNIPAVRLARRLGPALLHSFFQKAGFRIDPDPKRFGSGLALGTAGARLIESCRAFASFAARGWLLPLAFAKKDGKALFLYNKRRRLFSEGAAWYVTDILSDAIARRRSFGDRNFLDFPFPVAAKTGTSKDYKDSWTIGFTPRFVVGVWVGRFSGGPMQGVSGSEGAGRIFQQAMRLVAEKSSRREREFTPPSGWQEIEICPASGLRARSLCPAHHEWVAPNSLVLHKFCPRHVGPKDLAEPFGQKAPSKKQGLFSREARNIEKGVPFAGSNGSLQNHSGNSGKNHRTTDIRAIQILSPLEGEVYYLDPHTPQRAQAVPFQIRIADTASFQNRRLESPKQRQGSHRKARYYWRINQGPWQAFSEGFTKTLSLRPGKHRLEVRLPSGKILSRNFVLK